METTIMRTFKTFMTKQEFTDMFKELLGYHCKLGYVNEELGLSIRNFAGWDDWYSFGEFDNGEACVYCHVSKKQLTELGLNYLLNHNFKEVYRY